MQIIYTGKRVGAHKLDLVVQGEVVIELKTVENFVPYHKRQLISALKASGYKLGIVVNFSKNRIQYRRVVVK